MPITQRPTGLADLHPPGQGCQCLLAIIYQEINGMRAMIRSMYERSDENEECTEGS